jgi:hypothetical protein
MKGLHYLRLLVKQPGVEISALDLATWVSGHAGVVAADAPLDDVIDRTAVNAYRSRLRDLDGELAEAQDWSDPERVARLESEREALLAQLLSATGLAGRSRSTGSSAERARVAVRKAVAAAIDRIAESDAVLGRLLGDTVKTGAGCRYEADPGRPVHWVL